MQQELFPESGDAFDYATVNVVIAAEEGHSLDEPAHQEQIDEMLAEIGELPQLSVDTTDNPGLMDPVDRAAAMEEQIVGAAQQSGGDIEQAASDAAAVSPLSDDGRVGIIEFAWDVGTITDVEPASIEALEDLLDEHSTDGLVGFLLSVIATLGATVAITQEGAFGIFEGQPIVSFMPISLIGVVFGLAMNYQVFLVTRMREAHVYGLSTKEAVVDGFRNSARVVTAAAAIMTAVFAGFILESGPVVKSMGFALAASNGT